MYEIKQILICFPMKYRDFSVKINSENNSEITKINSENNSEITNFIFTVCKKTGFYQFSAKSHAQNVAYLSEIMARTLTFHDRTADVTYCADVKLFIIWRCCYSVADVMS